VSKSTKFSGAYSLSVFNNNAAADGQWAQSAAITYAAAAHTVSGRVKTSSVAGATGVLIYGKDADGTSNTNAITGTNDWQAVSKSWTASAGNGVPLFRLRLASGTVWFDLLWLAQQAYDTGNSDLTGQAYVATGARTQSQDYVLPPTGFNIDDCTIIGVSRLDHTTETTDFRALFHAPIVGTDYIALYFTAGTTTLIAQRRSSNTAYTTAGMATGYTKGDTLVWAARFSPTKVSVFYSLNGGAVQQQDLNDTHLVGSAPSQIRIGEFSAPQYFMNGTTSVLRILKPGATDAYIKAVMQNL